MQFSCDIAHIYAYMQYSNFRVYIPAFNCEAVGFVAAFSVKIKKNV